MMDWLNPGEPPTDEVGRDMELAHALRALDPASGDPNYWLRFRSWVMTEAGPELARRRMLAELTVGDVLASWSRAVVPTALAAGLAAIALIRAETPAPTPAVMADAADVGVEEFLVVDVPEESQPALLSPEAAAGIVAFAADIY